MGDYFFVVRSPIIMSLAESMVAGGYTKLITPGLSTYQLLTVRQEYVKTLQEVVDNILSINRVTIVQALTI